MSELNPKLPPAGRSSRHGIFGLLSFYCFQLVIMTFGGLVLAASTNLAPDWLGTGREAMDKAMHLAVRYTLPMAAAGVFFGFVDYLQAKNRRVFGTVGLVLNGVHTLLCLILMRG